jgi:hypothetical protein
MPYKLLTGFNLPDGKGGEVRKEAGDVVDDLDDADVWVACGAVEFVEAPRKIRRVESPDSAPPPTK